MCRHWITKMSNLSSTKAVTTERIGGSVAHWNEFDEGLTISNFFVVVVISCGQCQYYYMVSKWLRKYLLKKTTKQLVKVKSLFCSQQLKDSIL